MQYGTHNFTPIAGQPTTITVTSSQIREEQTPGIRAITNRTQFTLTETFYTRHITMIGELNGLVPYKYKKSFLRHIYKQIE